MRSWPYSLLRFIFAIVICIVLFTLLNENIVCGLIYFFCIYLVLYKRYSVICFTTLVCLFLFDITRGAPPYMTSLFVLVLSYAFQIKRKDILTKHVFCAFKYAVSILFVFFVAKFTLAHESIKTISVQLLTILVCLCIFLLYNRLKQTKAKFLR